MNRRVAVRGIIVRDNMMLCFKLKGYEGKMAGDYWCTPGGGADEGEDLHKALSREMLEETGIPPVIGNLLYVQQFLHNNTEQLEFFFHVTNADDYLNIDLAATTHGLAEIEEFAFINPAKHHVLPAFLTTEPLTHISPLTPTKFFSYL